MESQHTEVQVNYIPQINNKAKSPANYVRNKSGFPQNRKARSCGYCGAPELYFRKTSLAA